MPRIDRSRTSISDYEEIWRYIARDNPSAADRLITAIESILNKTIAVFMTRFTLATLPSTSF